MKVLEINFIEFGKSACNKKLVGITKKFNNATIIKIGKTYVIEYPPPLKKLLIPATPKLVKKIGFVNIARKELIIACTMFSLLNCCIKVTKGGAYPAKYKDTEIPKIKNTYVVKFGMFSPILF